MVVALTLVVKGFPSVSLSFMNAVMDDIGVEIESTSYCNAKARVFIRIMHSSCFRPTALGTQHQLWFSTQVERNPMVQTWQGTVHCLRVVETAEGRRMDGETGHIGRRAVCSGFTVVPAQPIL